MMALRSLTVWQPWASLIMLGEDDGAETGGERKDALASIGRTQSLEQRTVTRAQLAPVCGWRVTSGHLRNVAGSLSSAGLIAYPGDGLIALTDVGVEAASEPDLSVDLQDRIREILSGPQQGIFNLLARAGAQMLAREAVAEQMGWSPSSGHLRNVLGSLSSLELIEYPMPGFVALQDWAKGA